MRVSGELKVGRIPRNPVGDIGFMDDHDLRFFPRNAGEGLVYIGSMLKHIIDADHPQSLTLAFERQGSVAQHSNGVMREDLIDHVGAIVMVVIAEHGQRRAFRELLKHLRTRLGMTGGRDSMMAKNGCRDEVAGEHDQIRL